MGSQSWASVTPGRVNGMLCEDHRSSSVASPRKHLAENPADIIRPLMEPAQSAGRSLQLPGHVDLNSDTGRAQLIEACHQARPSLDANTAVSAYLRCFTNAGWRMVNGGMVGIGKSVHDLGTLLEYSLKLNRLSRFPGFVGLIHGLTNPSQVVATLFEIDVAWWCATRRVSQTLAFGPQIAIKAGSKRPDFRWDTALGRLYCECKDANDFEGKAGRLSAKLLDVASSAYDAAAPWDPHLRLDLRVAERPHNRIEERIDTVVRRLAASQMAGGHAMVGEVEGMLRSRSDDPPAAPGSMRGGRLHVGTTPTQLVGGGQVRYENASITLTRSVAADRLRKVRDLIREARRQLPQSVPSAIFLNISPAQDAIHKAQSILLQPQIRGLFMIAFAAGRTVEQVVWRQGQRLDSRLFEPAERNT
jgi:hypothetical protein